MADKPILFTAPMIRALLADRKTQTRRTFRFSHLSQIESGDFITRYLVGDRLWVREAHAIVPRCAYRMSIGTGTIAQMEHPSDGYSAALYRECFDRSGNPGWRPSIHLPRWASRITLIVTDVRIERLQDISETDALAEGIHRLDGPLIHYGTDADSHYATSPKQAYAMLWDRINATPSPRKGDDGKLSHYVSYPWDGTRRIETHRGKPHHVYPNPWIAVYTFSVTKQNIDQISEAAS